MSDSRSESFTRSILQIEQVPALSLFISGCIGQVYPAPAVWLDNESVFASAGFSELLHAALNKRTTIAIELINFLMTIIFIVNN